MQVFRGKGRLYDSRENFVDDVTYEIHLKSNNSARPVWWGEIVPRKDIMPVGNYILELEDSRRGTCITKMNTYSSFGLVVDSYSLEGTSQLKH
jgi:hypothetical protein